MGALTFEETTDVMVSNLGASSGAANSRYSTWGDLSQVSNQIKDCSPFRVPFKESDLEYSIVERFRQVATILGSSIAITGKSAHLSYTAIEQQSNAFGGMLIDLFGDAPEPVVILMTHGIPYHVFQLAVLKSRKFFVSIDPSLSMNRILLMLRDLGARVLLVDDAHEGLASKIRMEISTIVVLNAEHLSPPKHCAIARLPTIKHCDIATVVYTSGSTGPPQGVILTHQNILFIAMSHGRDFQLSTEDRATHVCPHWTIASNSEAFTALLNGVKLYPYCMRRGGRIGYLNLLRSEGITTFTASPVLFRLLFSSINCADQFPSVRLIRLGGDRTTKLDLRIFKDVFSDECLLRLGYGSSEFVVATQLFVDKSSRFSGDILPIGYPVEGCEVFLVGTSEGDVAGKDFGEIAIRSKYLSPGYWLNPDLTSKRFGQESSSSERVYYTRDFGRIDANGCLHHSGRSDSRIKIYGKFVLVSDIEEVLLAIEEVRDAVVMPVAGHNQDIELVAFVRLGVTEVSVLDIRLELLKVLSPEQVPKKIFILEVFPLLVNNKIDRLKLREFVEQSQA